jgi:hypothetical protein
MESRRVYRVLNSKTLAHGSPLTVELVEGTALGKNLFYFVRVKQARGNWTDSVTLSSDTLKAICGDIVEETVAVDSGKVYNEGLKNVILFRLKNERVITCSGPKSSGTVTIPNTDEVFFVHHCIDLAREAETHRQ